MPTIATTLPEIAPTDPALERRSLAKILLPFEEIAGHSPNLVVRRTSQFEVGGERYELPSYVFIGPQAEHPPIRVAVFAGLHGNEVEGMLALLFLVQLLEAMPDLARGYCLFLYPVCNPTGYEDASYLSREGRDLNREFWKQSDAPEIRVLEGEIKSQKFDGVITLHSNQTEDRFSGYSSQPLTFTQLVKPALQAVDQFINRAVARPVFNRGNQPSREQDGALSLPIGSEKKAFEIVLDAPNAEAAWLLTAVLSILKEHAATVRNARKS